MNSLTMIRIMILIMMIMNPLIMILAKSLQNISYSTLSPDIGTIFEREFESFSQLFESNKCSNDIRRLDLSQKIQVIVASHWCVLMIQWIICQYSVAGWHNLWGYR